MHTCMNSYIKTSPPIITSTTEKRENDIHSFNPDISIAPPKSTTTQRRSRPQQLTVSEFTRRSATGNRIHTIQYIQYNIHGVSEKTVQNCFCQLFINFNDFGDLDEKMAEILCYIYIFHLTSLTLSHYLVKYKSTKFYSFSGKL